MNMRSTEFHFQRTGLNNDWRSRRHRNGRTAALQSKMIPKELRAFIRDDDDWEEEEPRFYIVHRPGSELIAAQIVLWISDCLDSVPDRTKYKWKVWFSEMACGMVKERFWEHISLIGYKEWLRIPSRKPGDWSLRIRIAGTEGGIEDLTGDEIIDRVTVKLEIDDGNYGFMP